MESIHDIHLGVYLFSRSKQIIAPLTAGYLFSYSLWITSRWECFIHFKVSIKNTNSVTTEKPLMSFIRLGMEEQER